MRYFFCASVMFAIAGIWSSTDALKTEEEWMEAISNLSRVYNYDFNARDFEAESRLYTEDCRGIGDFVVNDGRGAVRERLNSLNKGGKLPQRFEAKVDYLRWWCENLAVIEFHNTLWFSSEEIQHEKALGVLKYVDGEVEIAEFMKNRY